MKYINAHDLLPAYCDLVRLTVFAEARSYHTSRAQVRPAFYNPDHNFDMFKVWFKKTRKEKTDFSFQQVRIYAQVLICFRHLASKAFRQVIKHVLFVVVC